MAEKGYLISQGLLNDINRTNKTVKNRTQSPIRGFMGRQAPIRYLVKITSKYQGSNWSPPASASYTGEEVIADSGGELQTFTGGTIFGDDTDSASFPPILDLRSLETVNGNSTDTTLQRIPPNSYVEVFQKTSDEGELYWYTNGLDPYFDKSFKVDLIEESAIQKVRVESGIVYNDLVSLSITGDDFAIATGYIYAEYKIALATNVLTVTSTVQFTAGARPDEFSVSAGVRTCKIPLAQITSGGQIKILHDGEIDANQDAIRTFELFPVNVTQTSGSAGNATTACTFTYTVNTIGSVQLLTVASPVWNRPAKGKLVAGTSGTAYFNDSNVAILYQVDEVPFVSVCP
jgi:hypothetical protein